MLRTLFSTYINRGLSRREFVAALGRLGVGSYAAGQLAASLEASGAPAEAQTSLRDVTGGQITCEILKDWGVEYVFGNTGAYEAGFVDALVDYPGIRYVLGLHEGPVMAMADGYARATGRTAFVNVHSMTGTGNVLGLMINAFADSSPIVVSVGFSPTSVENTDAFTETRDLEDVPRLYTKLSMKVNRTDTLAESLRRSFQLASALPSGPVFVGVPMDVWAGRVAEASFIPAARSRADRRVAAHPEGIEQAARWLAEARNPLLVAGAELPRWGGLAELVEIADRLGSTVSGDTSSSRSSMGFPSSHPRYLGPLRGPIASDPPFDVVLIAGASRLSLMRGSRRLLPEGARIIELGIREDHLARSAPADLLMYAHPQVALADLAAALADRPQAPELVASRSAIGEELRAAADRRRSERLEEVAAETPIAPERLASEIHRAVAPDAVIVTETVSSDPVVWDYIGFDQPGGGRRHIVSSGGSLGWGLGAAIGAKLGVPEKQVVALVGDGSFQFATQALWTASRFDVPMIVVIFNNRAYQANRWALAGLRNRAAETGHYIGISLEDPDIDHVGIARSYGLDGERVTEPDGLAAALGRAVAAERAGKTWVLDVVIARRGGGADATWHEKFSVAGG